MKVGHGLSCFRERANKVPIQKGRQQRKVGSYISAISTSTPENSWEHSAIEQKQGDAQQLT